MEYMAQVGSNITYNPAITALIDVSMLDDIAAYNRCLHITVALIVYT